MAANSYFNSHEQHQHLLAYASPLSDQFSQPPTPLKPLHFAQQIGYQHNPSSLEKHDDLQDALLEDAHLKSRIRKFRVLSRILSTAISIGVLAPITMTVIKFLQTRNTYRTIQHPDGTTTTRTAWAHDSKVWPTYSYFGVALMSTILNFATIFSYRSGVRRANSVSYVTSLFSWAVMLANVVVWSVAAGVYRNEKDKHAISPNATVLTTNAFNADTSKLILSNAS
ncbi:hypothetical protein E8E13_009729 [Curvularia kusanoi]|uniref:Uncharacterized protein n=1 Tax=Curvularia kusanoi TaxID=90978 RepID=A0A9P4TI88_CURKU|nr:hypothetical protein E8E13_009729 [Curvularia kusanoi]